MRLDLINRVEIEVTETQTSAQTRIQEICPEHLCLDTSEIETWVESIPYAGAVYIGSQTSVVLGDYGVGPNHTLPTGGWASRASAISVRDFQKTTHVVQNQGQDSAMWKSVSQLAQLENMFLHSLASIKQIQDLQK